MALTPESSGITDVVSHSYARLQGWVQGLFGSADFSPEESLSQGNVVDVRLIPRAPMSSEHIDVGLLAMLGQHGMKRGKLVTAQSHPELMGAWAQMTQRAGLPTPPQLIIVESKALNALTISPQEVAVTTGLLKVMDLREVVAVLGHELGHASSNHTKPRVLAMGVFGGLGAVAGDAIAHRGGIGSFIDHNVENPGRIRRAATWLFGHGDRPSSLLSSVVYIASGLGLGTIVANQIAVKPTELDADRKGAIISGDPLALASALHKLETNRDKKPLRSAWGYLRSGYPSMAHRIGALEKQAASQPHDPVLAHVAAAPAAPVVAQAAEPEVTPPTHTIHAAVGVERVATPVVTQGIAG